MSTKKTNCWPRQWVVGLLKPLAAPAADASLDAARVLLLMVFGTFHLSIGAGAESQGEEA